VWTFWLVYEMNISVCGKCGAPISARAVKSWRDVEGGREMFWLCPKCKVGGSFVLSDMVVRRLAGAVQFPVDERLVSYFRVLLDGTVFVDDIWEWKADVFGVL